jgi:DNA-binding IclR family transcriptional regulator
VGKAILSRLSKEEVRSIVSRVGLPGLTEATITDLDALYQELEETRQRGYALDRGEHEAGVYCVGAPILDARGQVIGSCSVSGADPEIVHSKLPEFSVRVMHTAQEISRHMGFVPAKLSSVVANPVVYEPHR